jgi:nucleoside-diphosphate-sugar epimerase
MMPGALPERALIEPRTFRNTYEEAKADAETLLVGEMEAGLPATIHRPSMVVGDSATGRIIQFQVFYHLCEFLSGRRTAGIVPDSRGFRLDIIPVDYVARAIQLSTGCADAAGRIFNLCTGPDDAPLLDDIGRRVRNWLSAQGRAVPPLRVVSPRVIRALLPAAKCVVGAARRRALNTIPFFLDYLESPSGFANSNSRRFFAAAGLDVPAVGGYLDSILGYYLQRASADALE